MRKILFTALFALCFVCHAVAEDLDSLYAKDLLKPGTEVPDFTLKNYKGEERTLSKARGQYVVLDFWASWCPDCRKDIPAMTALHQAYKYKNVRFIGVSFDTDSAAWQGCVRENKMFWTQLCELKKMRESQVAKDFGVKWIPSMYLIDPAGEVVLGTVDVERLGKRLSELKAAGKIVDRKADKMPQFPGGTTALSLFLSRNLQYPKKAQQLGAQGKVVVGFIVDTDGTLKEVAPESTELTSIGGKNYQKLTDADKQMAEEVVKDLFNNEAVRVVKALPKWQPGEDKGKPIRVKYHIPVTFKLR